MGNDEESTGQHLVTDALPAEVLSDLALIVLAEETLDSVLSKIVAMAKKVMTGADEVSVTLVRKGRAETAAHTGELAMQADERQYGLGNGPCLDAGRGGETLLITDMRTDDRWPKYAPQAVRAGVLSSLSIPLPIQEDLVGALNVYARVPDAFDDAAVEAGKAFAAYAAIAIANASALASTSELADHLRFAMESRAAIEQAKGILIAREGVSPEQAFEVLVRASQRENRKLRDLAVELVQRAQRPPTGGSKTPSP